MKERRPLIILLSLAVLLVSTVFIWSLAPLSESGGVLTVAFLDVGQGDAVYVEAPSGAQMLIDGGASRGVLRELGSVMPFYDRSIDVVVATHPDEDHIGGLPDILERFDVGTIVRSGSLKDTGSFAALSDRADKDSIPVLLARSGMNITLDEQTHFEILFPDRDVSGMDANSASVIGRLTFGESAFMLTGDAPSSIEEFIVAQYGEYLASDVLKVGHHGSKTSSAASFIAAVAPRYAVVSAEANSRYGHPHAEVVERFENFGSEIVSTAEDGTLIFQSNGERVWVR